MMSWRVLFSLVLLGGCMQAAADPQTALRPYYAGLRQTLPAAPAAKPLDPAAALTRISVGSCFHQELADDIWSTLARSGAGLFLFIGDNVYGDVGVRGAADQPELRAAYGKLAASPGFAALRANMPMLATWDDHDYGMNDAGGDFAFKEHAEKAFETFWGSSSAAKARPGIYDSVIVGPVGQRVQVILLDTRFFRSPLKAMPYSRERRPLGNYLADDDPAKSMLGDAQWAWLEAQLRQPADVRIIASSIQVVADGHNFERWGNLPRQRQRLYDLIGATGARGVVLVSGDRHIAGIYRQSENVPYPLYELTASSLNLAFGDDSLPDEPVPQRIGRSYRPENFGLIDIDWPARQLTLRVQDKAGQTVRAQTTGF